MVRTFVLHDELANAAGYTEFRWNADNQHQLLAALRNNKKLDLKLRALGKVGLVATDEDDSNMRGIDSGFNFGDEKRIHVVTETSGAWTLVAVAIIAIIVSVVITKLTQTMTSTSQGPGGSRSTMFNGPVNSTDQGGPIPIPYGIKVLVGSNIISASETYYNTL